MDVPPTTEILLGLLAVVALIAANGYFVAAEFSYVAVRRTRLVEAADSGDGASSRALRVHDRLSFMLSGAQLGITATSLLVGFVAEPTIGRLIRPGLEAAGVPTGASVGVSLTIALILATAVQMIIGELAPKNLAIARPEPVARALARLTLGYLLVAGPVIRLFDGASNALLRIVRVQPIEALEGGVSSEELEHIIEASGREGSLTPGQTALLERALDFRELRAADAMVPRTHVTAITAGATGTELLELARSSGHSRFLVIEDGLDDVHGIVQLKDLLGTPQQERGTVPVSNLASEPLAVPETTPLPRLLSELRAAQTQLAVVVDEHGGTAGIVTLEDVVEELVGEIRDEHDPTEPEPARHPSGVVTLPGSWRIDETEREVGIRLPEGDYDTLSGLVMARLGRMPEPGDVLALDDAELEVERLDGHAVGRVRLTPRGGRAARGPVEGGRS